MHVFWMWAVNATDEYLELFGKQTAEMLIERYRR
jgi:hypothetical protein